MFASSAAGEVPSREVLQQSVILSRRHQLVSNTYNTGAGGLWRLNLAGEASLTLLRPFFTATGRPGSLGTYSAGSTSLASVGDRIVSQSWPYEIHFDAFGLGLVNRLPVGGGDRRGWGFVGPTLGSSDAASLGLSPGAYGVPVCFLRAYSVSHWVTPMCGDLELAGLGAINTTRIDALLYDPSTPASPVEAEVVHLFSRESWGDVALPPSFDLHRSGLWRGHGRQLELVPIENGQMQPVSQRIDLSAPPLNIGAGYLTELAYHAPSQRLLVTVNRTEDSLDFRTLSLDPDSGEVTDLSEIFGANQFPVTFTGLGEPPTRHEEIVPIVAETPGDAGTYWTTALWLFNPSSAATTVTVSRIVEGSRRQVVLAPHASRRILNALSWVGGGLGHDALSINSPSRWGEQVEVTTRIWTDNPDGGGTYGHAVPTVPAPFGYSNHGPRDQPGSTDWFNLGPNTAASHIDLDRRVPDQYRHNIGVLNPTNETVELELVWTYKERVGGLSLPDEGVVTLTVPPGSMTIRRIESLFPAHIVDGWVPRIGVFSARPAIIWYSMVDNRTGDATFVPFTSFSASGPNFDREQNAAYPQYRLALPAAAHTEGVGGSHWQTDLYGFDMLREWIVQPTPFVVYHPSDDGDCPSPPPGIEISGFIDGVLGMPYYRWFDTISAFDPWHYVELVDRMSTIFPDVVRSFPECRQSSSTHGALEILTTSWTSGFSRTYTTTENGGTFGAMLPLYPPGGWPVQHFAGLEVGPDKRVNLGLFNGNHEHAVVHRLILYAVDGTEAATTSVVVESVEQIQMDLAHFFGVEELLPGLYGLTVVPLDEPEIGLEGRSWAFVSVVDNQSNDPFNLW